MIHIPDFPGSVRFPLRLCIGFVYWVWTMPGASIQCWCYFCSGKIVTRVTYILHGRKDAPDEAVRAREMEFDSFPDIEPVNDGGMPAPSDEDYDSDISSDDDSSSDEEEPVGRAKLFRKDVEALFLDWMCASKATDTSGQTILRLLDMLLPGDSEHLTTMDRMKRVLSKFAHNKLLRITVCRNDCVAYWDSTHLPEPIKNAHRTRCPICDLDRDITDPRTGAVFPAKVIFFCPVRSYIKGLYARADLGCFMTTDSAVVDEGDVRRSRGWHMKMLDNAHMAQDNRNLGFIGTTDGVPLFKDQIRSCWPFILRPTHTCLSVCC
jgi:hypothetical protein